jgi:hypothetical protein
MKPARLLLIGCCIALGVTGAPAADDAKSHWAFRPVSRPAPPAVKDGAWPRTSVDRFILAKLEEKGLKPSPTADRRTLIRRATFDLLGLPPTPEEVAAFEADTAPDAYERLIDRLLASPHYGERWGRFWLDVGRYADTKGYVFFEEANFPWAWTYRDYVIRAFNDDLPYNRFILEQLAADKLVGQVSNLPSGEGRQVGNLPHDKRLTALGFLTLGGRFMNNAHDIIDDRIDVVTRGLLGMTVACARCHDHKYDPITQRDYYALYGVFASCAEPTIPPLFADPPDTKEYAAFAKELQAREAKLTEFVRAKHDELVKSAQVRVAEYLMAANAQRDQPTTEEFMLIADGADLNPTMIVRYQKYLERTRKSRHPAWVIWHALADLPEKEFAAKAPPVCAALAKPDPAHPVNPLVARAFADKPPKTLADAARLYGELLNEVEKSGPGTPPDPAREELRQAFHAPDAPANVALLPYGDLSLLPDRPSQGKLQELRKAVEQWRATGPGAPPRAMVLVDLPTPYEPHVFRRGNPNNLGEAVPRQFLEVLSGPQRKPFTDGSGRLELAKAIASKDNPLTARVLVNRLWLHHFGRGLVTTPSDFGLRSDPPSHPELLDHLATAFVDGGWSVKAMQRLILRSAAYRQRDDDRPDCRRIDPENALVWRMVPRRLDFEATRDALLSASGRLSHTIGGPSVNDLTSPAATRRTLYGHLDRLNVPGLYRTFDFPSPDATSPQRDTTTVAPQALFLMNHPFSIESARRLARRPDVIAEKDVAGKVTRLYRVLYGRAPKAEELRLAEEYLGKGGDAAWERYAQALLMADEFVFVD